MDVARSSHLGLPEKAPLKLGVILRGSDRMLQGLTIGKRNQKYCIAVCHK